MTEEISIEKINNGEVNEEYAYLERGGFSSENFKIELRGLPKFYGIAELKKLINQKLGLKTSKIKRPKNGSHWLYACFQNDEERTKAIAALNGYSWKGKTLVAEVAKPAPDPFVRKRKQEEEGDRNDKKKKEDDGKSQEERLKDATTPYWRMPYEEQLKAKEKEIRQVLQKMDNEIWKINKNLRSLIEENRKKFNGLSFELLPIEASPVTEGYRNKCEFTVGIDDETKLPTVGFRLGSYVTGTVGVAPVQGMIHVSEEAKKAVLIFQEFVRKSGMAPFSPADYSGYWRYLTVRNSKSTGDVMLIVAMHPQQLSPEELDKIKKELAAHFAAAAAAAECGIKSLYFELITKKKSGEEAAKPELLWGASHIMDSILGLHFRISPEAFFQINTAGADILYQKAIDMSATTDQSTVVDICCGTGTIGLCFAKHCNKVLGLELIEEAVKDARANCEHNGVGNCEFFAGRAEDTLPSVLARAGGGDVVAIVDPPRAGLHMRAITQLRNTQKVTRLVYISCSPASAVKNFVDLSRASSKTLRGAPFVPVRAVPVDMFPNTRHVELAILFEREKKIDEVPVENDGPAMDVEASEEVKQETTANDAVETSVDNSIKED
ncbi:unnamed protein product [Plutella xylostella]|uniref:tRNA (uracil(54)-C(5))-methyltransferase n=1 Tax=Plutella xylostella TaxID=51655 RepID=A0A8S4DPI9_PLUXY|nr:unnamed protein product [Plutella xylostella]